MIINFPFLDLFILIQFTVNTMIYLNSMFVSILDKLYVA